MEIVQTKAEESPQVHKGVLPDSTPAIRDVRIKDRGKIGEMGPPISSPLGAMRPLLWKLGNLLRAPPPGCSSKRVKDGMYLLKKDVKEMSSFLDALSEVEEPPAMAKCWMNEARGLSYDMEDYVDSLYLQPAEEPFLVADNIISRRKWFNHTRTPKKLTWDEQIEGTLSEFRVHVKHAMERQDVYGLKFFSTKKRTHVSVGCMRTTPYEETSEIVINGRMNEFINSLVSNNGANQLLLKVASVLGPACLGKTTLARVLYNRFGNQYDCRAFIRVSKKPDMKRIFRDMLSELQRQDAPQYYEEIDFIDNIKAYLYDKRYLVIIDDLWDASVWDNISRAFPKGTRGSRIITTTQIEDVAFRCCRYHSEHIFEVKTLDDHHSRKLFFNKLFGSEKSCPQQWKGILNKIVRVCGGSPLTTIIIASHLANQPVITENILTNIHESLSSSFLSRSISERTSQALMLSFNNLPHYLKTCLLYLSKYSEGSIILRHDLVKQWMAENLIDTTKGEDMEEVAVSYLDQLIGRRFIQPICLTYSSEVLSFTVHDIVHDLIAHKSAEENFIVAIDDSPTNLALFDKTRRLSLLFGDTIYAKIPEKVIKSQVRSFTYSGYFECMPSVADFKLLRVLNLQLSYYDCDEDPVDLTAISELFQLRYLKIVSDVRIELPNHVLPCIETLDITDVVFSHVPLDVNFPHLLHLYLSPPVALRDWMHTKISLVSHGKLIYLQELHITLCSPTTLTELEEHLEGLGSLLRGHVNLKIITLAHGYLVNRVVPGSVILPIYWDRMEPPPPLQRFEFSLRKSCIFYFIPQWVGKLGSLCILKIEVKELKEKHVDMLRGLAALTDLALYVEMSPTDKITFGKATGFSVLKYFKLRCSINVAWLKFEADSMPNLLKLKLVFNCIPMGIMDRQLQLSTRNKGIFEQHKPGTPFISIEHMPALREFSAKFGGAASDVGNALTKGVSNHPSNPKMNRQVDHSCYGDEESIEEKQQPASEIVEDEVHRNKGKKSAVEIVEDEPDRNKGKKPAYEILETEPDGIQKKQPDTIPEIKSEKYVRTFLQSADTKSMSSPQKSTSHLRVFSLYELMCATNNFSKESFCEKSSDFSQKFNENENYVGKRLFIRTGVYKGILPWGPWGKGGYTVGIRCLDHSYAKNDYNWLTDLQYLGRAPHPHIVKPLGFCERKKYVMLVYEYMFHGSLRNYILKNIMFRQANLDKLTSLPWSTRLKIALGAAKGLAFLHNGGKPIVHGDFTTSNIMLDQDYTAKLYGFGPRRDLRQGYTAESDVYNFGVVLLELLSGQPAIYGEEHGRAKFLLAGQPAGRSFPYSEDKLHDIMDPSLAGKYPGPAAWSTITTALRCMERKPKKRPSMSDVVEALEPLLNPHQEVWNAETSGDKPTLASKQSVMEPMGGLGGPSPTKKFGMPAASSSSTSGTSQW